MNSGVFETQLRPPLPLYPHLAAVPVGRGNTRLQPLSHGGRGLQHAAGDRHRADAARRGAIIAELALVLQEEPEALPE